MSDQEPDIVNIVLELHSMIEKAVAGTCILGIILIVTIILINYLNHIYYDKTKSIPAERLLG